MIKGIGAIPHNLIIKSGGFTYYPLNQFEIDGTVAVELYRQDSEGDKKKIFIFKGEKDELKKFKIRFPILKDDQRFTDYQNFDSRGNYKKVVKNIHPTAALYKLAENLHSEAATFNKKIKTGGKLTPNEIKAMGSKKITPATKKAISKNTVYVEFLNKDKNFKKDKRYFTDYENALNWVKKTFDKYSPDMIKYTKNEKKQFTQKPTVKKAKLQITVTSKKGETVTKAKLAKTVKAAVNKASYTQTGKTNVKFDKLVQAKAPGKRVSKTGRKYTETRANRSDKGKWL